MMMVIQIFTLQQICRVVITVMFTYASETFSTELTWHRSAQISSIMFDCTLIVLILITVVNGKRVIVFYERPPLDPTTLAACTTVSTSDVPARMVCSMVGLAAISSYELMSQQSKANIYTHTPWCHSHDKHSASSSSLRARWGFRAWQCHVCAHTQVNSLLISSAQRVHDWECMCSPDHSWDGSEPLPIRLLIMREELRHVHSH